MKLTDRRTKVVCTIGPSSGDAGTLRTMIESGMNVARLNFSHGVHADHQARYETIRALAVELGVSVGILADLQGPKMRTGTLVNRQGVELFEGSEVVLTTRDVPGDEHEVFVDYEALPSDVKPGDSVYLADGLLELRVENVDGPNVFTTVIHGGWLGEHKGINLPGVSVSAPALGPKDVEDLEYAVNMGVDYIALSFVRTGAEVVDLQKRIADLGGAQAVIAKIERPEALDNFDEILEAADAIMLARGDLGVELPFDELPQIQKRLIAQCNDAGVPVITATQMLESMTSHPRPTRAEVADVANAIYDGTDAIMLSGETASGQFPIKSVRAMADIALHADLALHEDPPHSRIVRMRESGIRRERGTFGDAIAQSACRIGHAIGAKRIVCFTKTGATAALIARYRPTIPITALTIGEDIHNRCAVIWGVDSACTIEPCNTDELHAVVDRVVLENGLAELNDIVVVAGGIPLAVRTRTNMLKIHRVGQAAEDNGDDGSSW